MATRHVLKNKHGESFIMILSGKHIFTGEGEGRVEQTFPSPAVAAEHLERVTKLRKRDGFFVVEVTELAAEVAAKKVDPLDSVVSYDPDRGRSTVTFKGSKVPRNLSYEVVERLLSDSPRSVQILCDPASPGDAWSAAFSEKSLPSVESYIFDTHFQTVTRQARNAMGDLGQTLAAMPSAERAFITGDLKLTMSRHEQIQQLYLLGDPLKKVLIDGVARSQLPELETLCIRVCADAESEMEPQVIANALRVLTAPRLHTIYLEISGSVVPFLRKLTATPLQASWTTLCIDAQIGDEDAFLALLKERASLLRPLQELGLPLGDEISQGAQEAAQKLLPNLADRSDIGEMFLPSVYADW